MNNEVHNAERLEKPNTGARNILTVVIVVALAVLLTLVILFSTGLLKSERVEFLPFVGENYASAVKTTDETEEDSVEVIVEETPSYMTIQLPMLYSQGDEECESVYMIDYQMEYTDAPLTAAYNALFNLDVNADFLIGNYVGTQDALNFDYVLIENGTASVYLTGTPDPIVGDCDAERLPKQIAATAMQFNTVSEVEIYLNGELY